MKNQTENPFERIKTLFGLGKPKTIVNKQNPYKQARQDTAVFSAYENAEIKLAPTTFQQTWESTEKIIVFVRNLYPPISVGLSIMVGYILSDIFASGLPKNMYWVVIIAISLLVFLLASIVESLKMVSAKNLFKGMYNAQTEADKPKISAYLKVLIFFLISLAISAFGGGELSKKINDNSSLIDSTYAGQIDSIKAMYKPQIALYDSQIVGYQNVDYSIYKQRTKSQKQKLEWLKKDNKRLISEVQTEKRTLQDRLDTEIKSLKTEGKESVLSDANKGQNYGLISACVIGVFELFFIVSFWFEYWYAYGCKEENRNFEILPQTFYEQFYFQNPIILGNVNPQNFAPQNGKIGFGMSNHAPRANIYANLNPNGFCHVCGSSLESKRIDALFCSTKCKNNFHNTL